MATEKFEVRKELTAQRLREVLDYNPATGEFVWRVMLGNRAPVGAVAGSVTNRHGYRIIRIDQRDYRAARLAFLWMVGNWPTGMADHIDGNRSNDRWSNLREATPSENAANAKRRSDQPSHKGVSFHRQSRKWSATIQANGHQRHLGLFITAEQASSAYAAAAREAFGQFARIA